MNLKYWEWENHPTKEKAARPSVKHLCDVLFENDAQAYRFARLLTFFKQRKTLRLRDLPTDELPKATWHRYLGYAERLGLVKKEHGVYELTNRLSNPLRNLADFYNKWYKEAGAEDLAYLYPKQATERKPAGKDSPVAGAGADQ
jgi:hypothetical protein